MAFVSEEIKEEDKEYFNSIGFTQLAHRNKKVDPYWWVIDREREIIMTCRGGIFAEPTLGYQVYYEKEFINIELVECGEGDYFKNNVVKYYNIKKIEIPQNLINKGVTLEDVKQLITEMFMTAKSFGHNPAKVMATTVTIEAEPIVV